MSEATMNTAQFTTKESSEISRLQEKINSNTSSALEVQIAQAQLDELRRSKEPALHNHKHNLRGVDEVGSGNSNIFHDDEAFERYNMGAAVGHHPGSKVANQAAADRASVKNNHKVRGAQKGHAENAEAGEPITLPQH